MSYNEGILLYNANVEVDNTPDLEVYDSLQGSILKSINTEIQDIKKESKETELENLKYDGLENLAGYICHKLKNVNSNLAANDLERSTYSWVSHLSEGGLSKPSNSLIKTLRSCDTIFLKLNGEKLMLTSGYIQKHLLEAKDIEASKEVKKLFF